MKVQTEINVENLRKIAFLIINASLTEIKNMSDEELVLRCVKNSLYCASDIRIIKEGVAT